MLVDLTSGFAQKANDVYDFPVKRGTEQWNALKSYQDKRDACTVPESLLSTMSTKGLIETFLNYPLLGDLMVFSTPQEGIRKLQENFNGARELLKRKDVAPLLLEKYTSIEIYFHEPRWRSHSDVIRKKGRILVQDYGHRNFTRTGKCTCCIGRPEQESITNPYSGET
jgi:hypothetical protein